MNEPPELPNILVIQWHDLGDWLGCYGKDDIASPNADDLARSGARFTQCFSTAPVCCPSRASMFTGMLPHATGVLGQINRGFDMHRDLRTLPQVLKDAGYATYVIGNNHACQDASWLGFDSVENGEDDEKPDLARRVFETHRTSRRSPFYLHIPTFQVHRPFGNSFDESVAERLNVPHHIPDERAPRVDLACFHDYIRRADILLGQTLVALDETGHAGNTLVIFTTDHGAGLPRAKHTLYDQGLRIALVMRWPDVIPSNTSFNSLISNADMLPTILGLIGREDLAPGGIHGIGFHGVFRGGDHPERGELFAEHTYSVMYHPVRAIRTRRHKYILNFAPGTPIMMEPGAIHRFGLPLIEQWYSAPLPGEELYDLESDPDEFNNLVTNPRFDAVRRDLHRRLIATLRESNDPLLHGHVPDPAGPHTPTQHVDHLWLEREGLFQVDLPGIWRSTPS